MCGIFGIIANQNVSIDELTQLAKHAEQRGRDSSGLFGSISGNFSSVRADFPITKLLKKEIPQFDKFVMGHSRLVTNGMEDNQPIIRDNICVIHNGIIVNHTELWDELDTNPLQQIDTEIIVGLAKHYLDRGVDIAEITGLILEKCKGIISCALAFPETGQLALFSNNGSLYLGEKEGNFYFASERFALESLSCSNIRQIWDAEILEITTANSIEIIEKSQNRANLVPNLGSSAVEEALLKHPKPKLKRCTKCILPETMPYISFNDDGVCNYCTHYTLRNVPRPKSELLELVKPYRRTSGSECIVPFSGGRDSCYGLHLIVTELDLKPITYTYDWGMVTDLGRRNISRMCAELGVENIIVADDIGKKRKNIAMNLKAWLKSPDLGMISIFTAGDKHFFRHVETIKKQTGINLNLWGINPLEVTHFKAGFLGIPPNFAEERVYNSDWAKQLRYQWLRLKAMSKSPGYFNSSLWDTLSGEYFRSFHKKTDYFHVFDYWTWEENTVDSCLESYDWEKAPDTNTTWRIGDGTAAFYNYIYYLVAGFTEHDTFRSNQIREGQISREEALVLVEDENRPRYQNLKWYIEALDMDFADVINRVNEIPVMYENSQ